MPADKPLNILWITFEDTYPRFGCYGDPVAQTPNVDRLAAEGCVWPDTFTTAPVCAPARCAVITGMYAASIGGHHMRTTHQNRACPHMPTPYSAMPPHYVKCLPEYLRTAGYYCTNNGKTDYQFDAPFTAWDENRQCARDGNENWTDTIHWRNRAPGQPFFAVFNLQRTHESGQWVEKGEPKTDPASVTLPPYLPDTLEGRKALARQYDNIAHNDGLVGRLLDQLEEDGLADETAVFIWSDHGEGLPRSKRWPYDSGLRVPMIVRWPGQIQPGTRSTQLISTVDLAPTVLSMTGLPIPAFMQGQAFLGPRAQPPRTYVYGHRDRYDETYDMVRAVRDGKYKYIRNYYPYLPRLGWIPYRNRHPIIRDLYRLSLEGKLEGGQQALLADTRPAEELYDVQSDPWETQNLADDPALAGKLQEMRDAMDIWRDEINDLGDLDESEMVRRWRPDGEEQVTAPVRFIPIDADQWTGREVAERSVRLTGPAMVQLHCPTQGASIGWTDQSGGDPAWQLYTQPIRLAAGTHTLRAKAKRIGWTEGPEQTVTFEVR